MKYVQYLCVDVSKLYEISAICVCVEVSKLYEVSAIYVCRCKQLYIKRKLLVIILHESTTSVLFDGANA